MMSTVDIDRLLQRMDKLENDLNTMAIEMAKLSSQVKYLCILCAMAGGVLGYIVRGLLD